MTRTRSPAKPSRMDRDIIGYGGNPPNPNWPGAARLAVNFVLNFEEGSEPSIGDGDPESEWGLTEYRRHQPRRQRPRPGGRGHVRLRLPRRLLAHHAPVRRARAAHDHLRLRPGAGAQPTRRRRHQGRRPRHLLPWLALGKALRTRRSHRASPHRPRGRLDPADDGGTAARLVLPQRARGEHAAVAVRGRRLSLRFRRLRRRTAVLDQGRRQGASGGAVYAVDQQFEVRPRHVRDRRRFLSLLPRCVRRAVSGGRDATENALHRPAHAHHRPSGAGGGPATAARPHPKPPRRLGHPAPRHRPSLGRPLSPAQMPAPNMPAPNMPVP